MDGPAGAAVKAQTATTKEANLIPRHFIVPHHTQPDAGEAGRFDFSELPFLDALFISVASTRKRKQSTVSAAVALQFAAEFIAGLDRKRELRQTRSVA